MRRDLGHYAEAIADSFNQVFIKMSQRAAKSLNCILLTGKNHRPGLECNRVEGQCAREAKRPDFR